VLDNLSKRTIRQTLEKADIAWNGFYLLRRSHATRVRMESKSSETAAITSSRRRSCPMYVAPSMMPFLS